MVVPFLFDDFNDNSIDTNKWNLFGSSGVSESGGQFRTLAPVNGLASAYSYPMWDLRKGVLAVQLSKTGTTDTNVYTYFGAWDNQSRVHSILGRSNSAAIAAGVNDMGAGTSTILEASIGLGPSLAAGTWIGMWYVEADKRISLLKSTNNGASWSGVYQFVVTGTPTFEYRKCGLVLGGRNFNASATTFTPLWDNLTYFATDSYLKVKVRQGGAWVLATPKVRVGGAWKHAITKVRASSDWKRPSQ